MTNIHHKPKSDQNTLETKKKKKQKNNQSTLEPKNDQKYHLSLRKWPQYPQKQKTTKYPLSIQMFYTHTSLA